MRKFEVSDIGDFHYRQLQMLIKLGLAEAHIVVRRCEGAWPRTSDVADRRAAGGVPTGEAIN
ncbi:hypothetical protein BSY18_3385 [Blastomonas sp. RAC04]|uniref:hypothetical protein n=1 Tax=Blastomonas sp. RAC04 TaxID=1842535 RepID=UPI00083DA629|nr:hypothetical protein [Blastomonas sp. RAC04]AOG01401.1 hypothetical protein BSY18_3385 [Blastomonas sp. RAC04]